MTQKTDYIPKARLTLLISLLIWITISSKPQPKCSPKQYYQIQPLIANQSAILNLDNLFNGYNLRFSLQGHEQWAKYITLNEKLRLQKKQIPDTPLVGLKSYHLEKVGNSWANSFVAMSQRNQKFFLSYGFLSANNSAPVINNDVKVQGPSSMNCYDAVIFPKADVIIVDCAVKIDKPDPSGYTYYNQFHFFRISNGSRMKVVNNSMFVPFQTITRRRLQLFTERISGNTYLLRSYMYDGVDQLHQNNTYIDVFMVSNPEDPWIVSIIDRTFLRTSTFRVSDMRVYLSEIYILDYTKGLHRIRINTQEDLVYSGFYQAKGFSRFNVYSNNLDDKFSLALANDHQVLQIDWSHQKDPILLTKYSLMPQSQVKQVFINQRFVVVLSSTVYSSKTEQNTTTYNYTWIFSRGDRTYTKAFQVIKHDTANTFVDLNLEESFLMVMDDEKIANYAVDEAILTMTLKKSEDFMDRLMNFTIVATSYQPSQQGDKKTVNCSFIFNFTQVEENNRTMWSVGVKPPPFYNANFPGKVVVPLYQYALGPNITYRITQVVKNTLKKYKVYQQDQLKINWQVQNKLKNLTFLRTETITHRMEDLLYIFTQDQQNKTYITTCFPYHQILDVRCNQTFELAMVGQINNWATTRFVADFQAYYIVAYTTKARYNRVYVYDLLRRKEITFINQGSQFAGNITNVQTYGKYMFVIKKYVKTVMVYNLQLVVDDIDEHICLVTHDMMYKMGVKYFSPELVQTSPFYPNILFIKSSDTIIVLDMNKQCVPKLLSVIRPVQNSMIEFSFVITLSHLIVTIEPNTILQYSLQRIYVKDIKQTKKYPMYGYKLPKNYDTDVSEYGNCMFITTVSQGGDYQVFIYRAGYPAVASLYDVIDLYSFDPVLVDTSGSFIDYVTVYSANQLRIFRQYQTPIAQIQNLQKSYQFYIEYYNQATRVKLELISVSVINLPTKITVNPKLNDIMLTKDLLYSGDNRLSEINDTDWYNGNVLTIKAECKDCDGKVIVKNHIHYENSIKIMPGLIDYDWTYSGGTFQAYNTILHMHHHGRVRQIVHIPQTNKSICLSISAPFHSRFQISACMQGQIINLYLTSELSHKSFTFAPYSSRTEELLKIQAVNQLLILVDTSSNPFSKGRTGGVFLYALNFDLDQDEAFEQIQYIDYTDFADSDIPQYVVNADLSYHPQTDTYRLYITQLRNGLYLISFKYTNYVKGITILSISKLDLPEKLNKLNMSAPYDSSFQAVQVVESDYDGGLLQSKDTVIVTMGTYHTLMIQVVIVNSQIRKWEIKKVFLRYAYYVVENNIKYVNGLLVLRQTLPEQYDTDDKLKSKQLITVYDIKAMPFNQTNKTSTPQLGLIGAHMITDRQPRTYDLNLTYNTSDPHQQPRINMAVVHQFSNQVDQLSLHRNLTVYTRETVDTQIIYLDLINDFDVKKIRILLNGWAPYPEWKLITIILFSIVGFVLLVGAAFVGFKKFKAYRSQFKAPDEQRGSLMTEQQTNNNQEDRYSNSYYS